MKMDKRYILMLLYGLATFGLVHHYTNHICISIAVICGLNYLIVGLGK